MTQSAEYSRRLIAAEPVGPLTFDSLWNRWIASTPGTEVALRLLGEIQRRHGAATAGLEVQEEE